jgi:methylated-DNA-[protein]-cysteine S-methyltransferase
MSQTVTFCLLETPLAAMGVVARGRALVRVLLFENGSPDLEQIIRRDFPGAQWGRGPLLNRAERFLRAYAADGRTRRISFPLDLGEASAFARRVVEACLAIPAGECRTYAELAAAAGSPGAARAVGQVMRRNPLPILIPCHRVVGAGGRLVGFSAPGGVRLKARLLEHEAKQGHG